MAFVPSSGRGPLGDALFREVYKLPLARLARLSPGLIEATLGQRLFRRWMKQGMDEALIRDEIAGSIRIDLTDTQIRGRSERLPSTSRSFARWWGEAKVGAAPVPVQRLGSRGGRGRSKT